MKTSKMEVPFSSIICSICNDLLKQPVKLSGCEHHFCFDCTLPNNNMELDQKSCPECSVTFIKYDQVCEQVKDRILEFECKMGKIDVRVLIITFIELLRTSVLPVQLQSDVMKIIVALFGSFEKDITGCLSRQDYDLLYEVLTNDSLTKILREHGFFRDICDVRAMAPQSMAKA